MSEVSIVAEQLSTGIRSHPEYLRRLEAESITILREVAAEFRRPVLLYSIGKDSRTLLHLAQKAFSTKPLSDSFTVLIAEDNTSRSKRLISNRLS